MDKIKKLALAIALIGATTVQSAHAGGFLADTFIRPFSPHAADEADKIHRDIGKPLDKAADAAVSVVAGTVVGGGAAPTAGK